MLEIYKLYYKNIYIGKLEVIDNLECIYTHNSNIDNEIINLILRDFIYDKKGSINDFPFFESRIRNMKKFNLTSVKYQTDFYELKQVL